MLVVPATQKAEAGQSLKARNSRPTWATMSSCLKKTKIKDTVEQDSLDYFS